MSSGRRRVGSDEYERGYAHGRRDAEHEFQRLMARAILWIRPNGRPERNRTALSQKTKRQKRGPNRKLQQKRSAKPRVCDICGAEFKYPSALKKHQRSHEGRDCPRCNEHFDSVQKLGAHTRHGHCKGG